MQNLNNYTNNINPTNTLKDYTPKNMSDNYDEYYPDSINNLAINSNLSQENSFK